MNSPVKKIGEQKAAIAAHSTRRERNARGRREHQMPAGPRRTRRSAALP